MEKFHNNLEEKMCQMDYLEEQLVELRAGKNRLDIFPIICQMEIMQILKKKDYHKANTIQMWIHKVLLNVKELQSLTSICQETYL